jgi:hypothetical protein
VGAQGSVRRTKAALFTAVAVVLVVAGVVAYAGAATSPTPREESARGTTEVIVSAWMAEAYSLRPDTRPDRTCRYPYQVMETGVRLVWIEDEVPFVAPPNVRGVWLRVGPATNTWMWFMQPTQRYTAWKAATHNKAGAWIAAPEHIVTWCGIGEPSARAPR